MRARSRLLLVTNWVARQRPRQRPEVVMSTKRILVAGATGALGRPLCARLRGQGHQVLAKDVNRHEHFFVLICISRDPSLGSTGAW
jgi:hypothetical protein